MTRQDYKVIAEAMVGAKPLIDPLDSTTAKYLRQWRQDITYLGDYLLRDNPRFNRSRFETACNV